MTEEVLWKEWQDILKIEFGRRMAAIGTKGFNSSAGKSITALFLSIKGLNVQAAEILSEVIRIINDRVRIESSQTDNSPIDNDQNDTVAMMGHRIGMVDNFNDLKNYLLDAYLQLKPKGQILLTSINVQNINAPKTISSQKRNLQFKGYNGYVDLSTLEFQYENLIGPFFSLVHFNEETWKNQSALAGWQFKTIYHRDDRNYLTLLTISESG
jgi:hypothetical protein